MDSIVSTALSEICSQGTKGISIENLWTQLQTHLSSSGLDLSDGVKKSIMTSLHNIPGLQFKSNNIVATQHLRDCYVGIYDVKTDDIERRVLDRLGMAKTDGITQNQLAKEFGMKGNDFFRVVKQLEVHGLIVRQPSIVRTNDSKNTSIVNTNLIRLYRYAEKSLNSLQKIEINKFDSVKDDVVVKDYVPAMKAICDELDKADGKVLVVSDMKQVLGYYKKKGSRAWKNICDRLLKARLVEEFDEKVDEKKVRCLRLIKKFDPLCVQTKHTGFPSDDIDIEQPVNSGKQGRNTDKILELPIEHQIYDLVDAEGSKEVSLPPPSTPAKRRSYMRQPCLFSTAESTQRKQRILERLQYRNLLRILHVEENHDHNRLQVSQLAKCKRELVQDSVVVGLKPWYTPLMDSIVSTALSEICSQGTKGISIENLWTQLQTHLSSSGLDQCDQVKKSIMTSLITIPGLEFKSNNITATQHLRDCYVGIYDVKTDDTERRVLDRLGRVRTDGVTQNQLAKEFGMKGNDFFRVVKQLEVHGLIVRQPSIVRTVENDARSTTSIVNTNLIRLYRYAEKSLNSLQKIEITKSDALESLEKGSDSVKDDVVVKDYVPAMKAICDILEKADGKVLVVSDMKQALGYYKKKGSRSWRSICDRLLKARLVEEFDEKVNEKKKVRCLRLIKKFDPLCVQTKHTGLPADDIDIEQPVNSGKQGRSTDQILELPIEHQIYDLVDAEGSKGMPVTEVCKRLGLDSKRNFRLLQSTISRFGMHQRSENHNRGVRHRLWTSGNFHGESPHTKPGYLQSHQKVDQTFQLHSRSPGNDGNSLMATCGSNLHVPVNENLVRDWDKEHELGNMVIEPIIAPSEISLPPPSTPAKCRSYMRQPCLFSTAESTQRKQRILERLQKEKFILTVELHKWLVSLEKDKHTTMDVKTMMRILGKLEHEGICRCIKISLPLVTNFDRTREPTVVLHNSLQNLSPELMTKIQERLRMFDMQIRGQGLACLKSDKETPVLTNINRTVSRDSSDTQPVRVDAMRGNGSVLGKMVRAKLLHSFLWSYLGSLPDWSDAVYSGRHGYDLKNPHSCCKLFSLALAVKTMPLELFLHVVGSTQVLENCNLGLCLADLPSQEYTGLMNIQATRCLSLLVDILCRLKLIRLVPDKDVEDREATSLVIYSYAMELKPYIEEPLSKVSVSLGFSSYDLRPRIRHDFVLSNKDAVDIYWKTLEYCYATADPKAATHAFPGSSVREVFYSRSWASVQVITADQRTELLKRILRDNPDKKISFSDCVKIAKDLNLTMEQVLSNDKRQSCLNKYQKDVNPITSNFASASRKRKRSKETPSKHAQAERMGVCAVDQEDHDVFFQDQDKDVQQTTTDDPGLVEEVIDEDINFIRCCALPRLKPSRRGRFMWTETSDRELVIQYVRNRAVLGPRFHRTEWFSLPDLPASPDTCRRRMHLILKIPMVGKAVMRLCTLLGDRYARHLVESQEKELLVCNSSRHILQKCSTVAAPQREILEENLNEQQWDDFEDENIKVALSEVLRCKQLARPEFSTRSGSTPKKDSHEGHFQEEYGLVPGTSKGEEPVKVSQHRSRCHRLPGKFLKLPNEGIGVSRQAYMSLAVSNAVELLKIVFLSTSLAPEVPNLLAETLRRYSEHDLLAAFNYLREKKFLVGGKGSQPFVLSQDFLRDDLSSPFPTNTGKRAAKFVSWLREREQDLMEDEIYLNEGLQCGDIFHLLALVSSGELFISPTLPEKGIGEADEDNNNNNTVKSKRDNNADDNVKRFKSAPTEVSDRRPKGFPGVNVSVSRITISQADAIGYCQETLSLIDTTYSGATSSQSLSDTFGSMAAVERRVDGSTWEAMTSYGNQLLGTSSANCLDSDLFKTAYSSIYGAGDQGLRFEQISELLSLEEEMVEFIVDVFQLFGVAVKVNAYNEVRIVDASFVDKYFLTTTEGRYQGLKPAPLPLKSSTKSDENTPTIPQECHTDPETIVSRDDVHKVTLVNLPKDASCNDVTNHGHSARIESEVEPIERRKNTTHSSRPILPWINGDGTTNPIVYKVLVRRVLGIVMQYPGILEDGVIYGILNPQVYSTSILAKEPVAKKKEAKKKKKLIWGMGALNPQSCRKLLELMVLDKLLIVRKMNQSIYTGPPSILGNICRSTTSVVCRDHFFGNPMSAMHL